MCFFLGTRKPIFPILKALDLFLLPSLWEGFSVALLEAMAMGVPVIATKVGGAEEVITSGQQGLLIPPGRPQVWPGHWGGWFVPEKYFNGKWEKKSPKFLQRKAPDLASGPLSRSPG